MRTDWLRKPRYGPIHFAGFVVILIAAAVIAAGYYTESVVGPHL